MINPRTQLGPQISRALENQVKVQIKHRYTDAVLFEADVPDDTPSGLRTRVALEKATAASANLRSADLYGADLRGADLGGANLYGANLGDANLNGANLYGADLRSAELYGADLRSADLYGADLYGADLNGADLYGADLRGADLGDAILYGANLRGADLRSANLYDADLRGANLGDANLRGANLYGADLRSADLNGKKLIGERPFFQVGPIGSRADYFTAFITDAGLVLRAGCFTGTVAEFEAKLQTEHGDNAHAKEYRAALALALIAVHAELWTPTGELND